MPTLSNVLVVDDSEEIQIVLQETLKSQYRVFLASTLKNASEVLTSEKVDLILLDVQLPDGNGLDYLKSLRESNPPVDLPVLVLTSLSALNKKVEGFELGADDYICKPFEPLEIMARVKSHIKKRTHRTEVQPRITGGCLTVDLVTQEVSWLDAKGIQNVELTHNELKLLCKFIKTPDEIIPRESLKSSVWGKSIHVSPRAIDKLVSSLKSKLSVHSGQIQSIYRKGYVFKGIHS